MEGALSAGKNGINPPIVSIISRSYNPTPDIGATGANHCAHSGIEAGDSQAIIGQREAPPGRGGGLGVSVM